MNRLAIGFALGLLAVLVAAAVQRRPCACELPTLELVEATERVHRAARELEAMRDEPRACEEWLDGGEGGGEP